MAADDFVDRHESDVVTVVLITRPGISEPDEEMHDAAPAFRR